MPLLATLPPFRKLMTLSMLGVVDGWFGRQLALELGEVRPGHELEQVRAGAP
jgi:hypothetical protein